MHTFFYALALTTLVSTQLTAAHSAVGTIQQLSDAATCFDTLNNDTRTKTWWFHGETKSTKAGITADLEAYQSAGLGGVAYYDQSHGNAENADDGFSKPWWDMIKYAALETKRLNLSLEINCSSGFVAGGPWITPDLSMKRLSATSHLIQGGQTIKQQLDLPTNKTAYYQDVAVLAIPIRNHLEKTSNNQPVRIHSNLETIDIAALIDPKTTKLSVVPYPGDGQPIYINFDFEQPFTARSLTYDVRPRGKATTSATNVPAPPQAHQPANEATHQPSNQANIHPFGSSIHDNFVGTGYRKLPDFGQLEASEDGRVYFPVCACKPIYKAHETWRQKTIAFPAVTARYFRLNLHDWLEPNESANALQLGRLQLKSAANIDQWEEKAGLYPEYIESDETPLYQHDESIDSKRIINISSHMDTQGLLHWKAPAGQWLILRFVATSTGRSNKHGRANQTGLECDKLSVKAVEQQWNNYLAIILDSLENVAPGAVSGIVMDSHEAGSQNWTNDFISAFQTLRGYDPTPYLPAMMGYVINDSRTTQRFLYDIRRTIADLMSERYYGTFERLCRERGLTLTAQAIGNALCIVGDPLQAKAQVSKPQGEFWVIHPDGNYDIKESASAAHIYGKSIASAEAFTDTKYHQSLADLKSLADYAYAFGINEFVICASPHQPWLDSVPGSTGGGRHYAINRNNPWWPYSQPFWTYQARNAHILRQGRPSAQVLVYLGDNAPVKILTHRLPALPGGYDFDACSTHGLLTRSTIRNGRLSLAEGSTYELLVLPRDPALTLSVLKKIAELVYNGAIIYGPKPSGSPALQDQGHEVEYQQLVKAIWGSPSSAASPAQGSQTNDKGSHPYGKGRTYWGYSLESALQQAGITPDIDMEDGSTLSHSLYFNHRKLADADVYFMYNHKDTPERNTFTFKGSGRHVQCWKTVDGQRFLVPLSPRSITRDHTANLAQNNDSNHVSVYLEMAPKEAFFIVVTDQKDTLPTLTYSTEKSTEHAISSDWEVYFDPKCGGPGQVKFDRLMDWTKHPDQRIKYYSGTAIYTKTLSLHPNDTTRSNTTHNKRYFLELKLPNGVVEVWVNKAKAGICWCSPWQVELTPYLKEGTNHLELHVANSLINRMIIDSSLPENKRITYAYPPIVQPTDSLVPSGIEGATLRID